MFSLSEGLYREGDRCIQQGRSISLSWRGRNHDVPNNRAEGETTANIEDIDQVSVVVSILIVF